MKKIFTLLIFVGYIASTSSCAVLSVFQKKEKYGCPGNARSTGAEKLVAEDGDAAKAIKANNKSKYKGGRKIY
jgi:hypothetical protein